MKIRSNHHWMPLLYWEDLTQREKEDLEFEADTEERIFFRFGGQAYSLSEFLPIESQYLSAQRRGWERYTHYVSHTAFDGVLINLSRSAHMVQAAYWSC